MNEAAKDQFKIQFDLQRIDFQFSQYAVHGLWTFPLTFLAFGIVDYVQSPLLASQWIGIRSFPLVFFWLSYLIMWKFTTLRRFVSVSATVGVALGAFCTHYFMWTSGGQSRSSWPLLILGVLATSHVFRVNRKELAWLACLSILPGIAILVHSSYTKSLTSGLIDSAFLTVALLVALTKNHDRRNSHRIWTKATAVADEEITKARHSDLLKKQFPTHLRQAIENHSFDFKERELSPASVIGFADFTHVSADLNSPTTGLFADWELKESFTEIATRRATTAGFIVLSSSSEGFCFVANFRIRNDWQVELMAFFEGLCGEFNDVVASLREHLGPFECGIRMGVSMGPMVLGWTRATPPHFEAIGPEIAMATKLCRSSRMNSVTFTATVWNLFRGVATTWETHQRSHGEDLRGIEHELPIAEVRSRLVINGSRLPCECGLPLDLIKTEDGLIDLDCANAHHSGESSVHFLRKSS